MRGEWAMEKFKYDSEMEARYRKQADDEPVRRDRHLASADAWRLLADMRTFVYAQQNEIREKLATLQSRNRQRE